MAKLSKELQIIIAVPNIVLLAWIGLTCLQSWLSNGPIRNYVRFTFTSYYSVLVSLVALAGIALLIDTIGVTFK